MRSHNFARETTCRPTTSPGGRVLLRRVINQTSVSLAPIFDALDGKKFQTDDDTPF